MLVRKSVRYVLMLLALAIAILLIGPRLRLFLQVDDCLDAGGAWNYERAVCER